MAQILKIAVSVPNEGLTKAEAYDNHLIWAIHLGVIQERSKQENWDEQYEFYWFTCGRILTPFAREQLVTNALKAEMDYILMLDDDMTIENIDIFERLIKHKVDVVAPLAFARNKPHFPVLYHTTEGYDPIAKSPYATTKIIRNYPKNKLVECDAVGFGMVLINMNVVKALEAPYFMSTTGTGEDVWFCIKARQHGFHVFMDTSLKLGHLGNPIIINEEVYEQENDIDEHRRVYGEYVRGPYFTEAANVKPPIEETE